ncbi:MAG: thermonuclease family protein [Planctomycetia bacterium]
MRALRQLPSTVPAPKARPLSATLRTALLFAGLFPAVPPAACAHAADALVAPQDAPPATRPATAPEKGARPKPTPPATTYEVVKVVDGDTLHIQRDGKLEKLRLLHVDTEETLSNGQGSASKPGTVFGSECALWAQEHFQALARDGAAPRVGLLFPGGKEERDVYGRLLCHVIQPDGTDYNLLLVELGKSPYFQKYGWSSHAHEAFVAAQDAARRARRGIWDPATNQPKADGAPSARRPYDQLLPWWEARAVAYANIAAARKQAPESCADAAAPEELERAAKSEAKDRVHGEVERLFEEQNGDLTVLMRTGARKQALRIVVRKEDREAHESLRLADLAEDYHQNLVWFEGHVAASGEGFRAVSHAPSAWTLAGPQPASGSKPAKAGG